MLSALFRGLGSAVRGVNAHAHRQYHYALVVDLNVDLLRQSQGINHQTRYLQHAILAGGGNGQLRSNVAMRSEVRTW